MKLILSRKGFDSQSGGIASPILDGRLVSLPIPDKNDQGTMADIPHLGDQGPTILEHLGGFHADQKFHIDPDLERSPERRIPGWRASLGQTHASQGHLRAQGVGVGDVFLFFGWFRRIELHLGKWRYVPGAPDLHVLFGWLEVGMVLTLGETRQTCLEREPWIADHPHVAGKHYDNDASNTLYVAAARSRWLDEGSAQGGGRFPCYHDDLRLTVPGSNRSRWSLPHWFMAEANDPTLSYHTNAKRWARDGDRVQLQSVGRGQEFVMDLAQIPESEPWLSELIRRHGSINLRST